jgi:hypothetical protein
VSLYVKVFTSFYTHRKTLRLHATLGNDAFWVPPRLWAYAAQNQPDGNFSDYSDQEIASCVGYSGDASSMLQALQRAGFLDERRTIHDWSEYNGYHKTYADRARNAANERWEKERTKEKAQSGSDLKGEERSIPPSNASSIKRNGNGHPNKKFASEINAQLKLASDKLKRLKEQGTNGIGQWTDTAKRDEFIVLVKRKKELESELLSK